MEYERHFEVVDGAETNVVYHAGPNKCIPSVVGNHDYEKMLDEVGAGTSTIVDVDDTHVPDYAELRAPAYDSVQDQLDMLYWIGENGTSVWRDHIASVKAAHPKPS